MTIKDVAKKINELAEEFSTGAIHVEMNKNQFISAVLLLLLALPFASAKDLEYPQFTLEFESNKIIIKQEKKIYSFDTYEGIQRVLQGDVDGDGDLEYIIGVQFRYSEVDIPYGSVLICKQEEGALKIQDEIFVGDYLDDITLFDVTKDGIVDLIVEGLSGMHCSNLKIISWQNGKYLTLLETSSACGVFFETDKTGNAQVKIGIELLDKEGWCYADEPDWEIWTWGGEKFVYNQGKTKESRSCTITQPIIGYLPLRPEPEEFGGDLVIIDPVHPIDRELGEGWKDTGVTSELVRYLQEAYAKWEAEMNKYYALLMDVLDKDSKKRLKESQKAWIKFRDSSFKFLPFYFQDIGSYQRPTMWCDKVRIVRARALDLRRYYLVITAK